MKPTPGHAAAVLALIAAASLAACGSGGTSSAAVVPSLAGGNATSHSSAGPTAAEASAGTATGQPSAGATGPARASALHAAAQCIRQHGVPDYADPVLTPAGAVYSDSRSIQDAGQAVVDAVQQACGALMTQADLNPEAEPPAPPQLVQAGVRAAECFRANGLPNVADPNAQTPYTPGHGFEMPARAFPAGGKASPVFQRARAACAAQVTAELQASTLASLGNDG
jgi:hypothetical protein